MRKALLLLTLPALFSFASAQADRPLKVKMPQLQSAPSTDSFIRGIYSVTPASNATAPATTTDSFIRFAAVAPTTTDSFIKSAVKPLAASFIKGQEKALRVKITTVPEGQTPR